MGRWRTARRWSEDDAREAIEAWRESETSLAEFAVAHGLELVRLQRWRRRLDAGRKRRVPRVMKVRVVAPEAPAEEFDTSMDIVLRNGVLVRVRPGFDSESIAALVAALSAC
ncbi:MAG: hypothetical protein QGG14_08420 [Planctomycetota bacterium]|jgi:transposase-like protein|nr:hypothetical protein [Planctomycetota bacterium]